MGNTYRYYYISPPSTYLLYITIANVTHEFHKPTRSERAIADSATINKIRRIDIQNIHKNAIAIDPLVKETFWAPPP